MKNILKSSHYLNHLVPPYWLVPQGTRPIPSMDNPALIVPVVLIVFIAGLITFLLRKRIHTALFSSEEQPTETEMTSQV